VIDAGYEHTHVRRISQSTASREIDDCRFVRHLSEYIRANNYSPVKRFDKVIAKIKWRTFCPTVEYIDTLRIAHIVRCKKHSTFCLL